VSLPLFLQGLGSIGVFASRAFLPAFVTALLIRFGPQVQWLAKSGLLPQIRDAPTWFTSDVALVALGLLAALELAAERSSEARVYLDAVHGYLKAGMATLTYLGVLSATERAVVGRVIQEAGLLDSLPSLAVGAGTLLAGKARGMLLGPLVEADEDDDLGLQGLIRWVEDLWAGLGPVALIVFPVLTAIAFGIAIAGLVAIERLVEARGERAKVPCARCGQPIHASAPACHHCGAPAEAPRAVGLLGRPKPTAADLATLPFELVAVKRCPACATRFGLRVVRQECRACGHRLMDDPKFARDYIALIDRRVPMACAFCLVVGLVPVVGVIPGVIYSRLAIVAPFRRYIPPGPGFLLRWGVRLAVVFLVALQWIPVAGALAVPALAFITYVAHRAAYRKLTLDG